jgi:hypothetical protein
MEPIEKQYADLAKKYKLPEFSKINHEFEICFIDRKEFLLREIGGIMIERIDLFIGMIDGVLNPDTGHMASLHEARFADASQKEELYRLYKILMHHQRTAVLCSLKREEKEEAAFIAGFFKDWEVLKPSLIAMVAGLQDSWTKDTSMKEDLQYFG